MTALAIQPSATAARMDPILEGRALAATFPDVGRRLISDSDRRRYEGYLAEILEALGLDLDTPGTQDTPRRFLAALDDATAGYAGDPKLVTAFPTECRGGADCEQAQIVEGPVLFHSLVRIHTQRFTVQERATHDLADALTALTNAHGVAVFLEAEHLCTRMRGVRELGSMTRTTAYRGAFERDASLRGEFRAIAGIGQGTP